jgi:hypothetical protein
LGELLLHVAHPTKFCGVRDEVATLSLLERHVKFIPRDFLSIDRGVLSDRVLCAHFTWVLKLDIKNVEQGRINQLCTNREIARLLVEQLTDNISS